MENNNDVWVEMSHLHSCPSTGVGVGMCHKGARNLCATIGLDWGTIVKDGGIWASQLEATNDALAIRLAEHARMMEGAEDGK